MAVIKLCIMICLLLASCACAEHIAPANPANSVSSPAVEALVSGEEGAGKGSPSASNSLHETEEDKFGVGLVKRYDCSGKQDGNYEHPTNPLRFITCVAMKYAWEQPCAECDPNPVTCLYGQTVFDPEANQCLPGITFETAPDPHADCSAKYTYIRPVNAHPHAGAGTGKGEEVEDSKGQGQEPVHVENLQRKCPASLLWDQKRQRCVSCTKVTKKDGKTCC